MLLNSVSLRIDDHIIEDVIVPRERAIVLIRSLIKGREHIIPELSGRHDIAIAVPHPEGFTIFNGKPMSDAITKHASKLGLATTQNMDDRGGVHAITVHFVAAGQRITGDRVVRQMSDGIDVWHANVVRRPEQVSVELAREFLQALNL